MRARQSSIFPAMRRLVVLAVMLVPFAFVVSHPSPANAGSSVWPVYVGGWIPTAAHFNTPANGQSDPTVINETVRLIDSAQPGDVLFMAIHKVRRMDVAEAMVRAKDEGVAIYAVAPYDQRFDSSGTRWPAVAYLDTHFADRIKWCEPNGCITTVGTMHAKFMVLSGANAPDGNRRLNVSWVSSSNLTDSTGTEHYNDSLTFYGDATLYNKLYEIFQDMWYGRNRSDNYFAPPRGYAYGSAGWLYASPEQESDLVATALGGVSPKSTSCGIRVLHTQISNRSIAVNKLRDLKRRGCTVLIVAGYITPAMLERLISTSTAYPCCAIPKSWIRQHPNLHSKAILTYDGGGEYRVLTGSHNLTNPANYYHDEVLVMAPNGTQSAAQLHDEYVWRYFNAAWNSSSAYP